MTDQIKAALEGPVKLARTRWPLEIGDLEPVAGLQAAAKPVGSVSKLAQEHLRLDAILVGRMGDGVSARWRERSIIYVAARLATANPGLLAVCKT
jgi:hypothetical protein